MRFSTGLTGALMFAIVSSAIAAPEFTGTWVNGEAIKASGLKGKIAVLVFYEEG